MRIAKFSVFILSAVLAVGFLVQEANAAAVFYSVGQNTSDHKTGSPTITISGGIATFSIAQTAPNIGVGDRVTYNGGSIAYISAKSSLTQWALVTAIGVAPADVPTGQIVNTITHEFTSLSAAIAGASNVNHLNTSDLVAGNYMLYIPCYYDSGPDTTSVTISGYTTGAVNFIKIYSPSDTSVEVNQSQRHQGMWTTNAYRLEITGGGARAITSNQDYLSIEGLQIGLFGNDLGFNVWAISINDNNGVKISKCIIKDEQAGTASEHTGISMVISGGKTGYIWNNMVYGFRIGSGTAMDVPSPSAANIYVYNNTIYHCKQGFDTFYQTPGTILKNNIVQSCADGFPSNNNSLSDYNISDLAADAPGIHSKNSATVIFVNSASQNFHLSPSDIVARGAGVNLSGDVNLSFNDDVDGQTRPGIWDIGADQYVVLSNASNIPYSIGSGAQINVLP